MSVHAQDPASETGRLAYSVEEAADLLGIGRTVMFHLVTAGEVGSFKIGRRRLVPRDAIDSYIERLRAEQPDERRADSPAPRHKEPPKR